MATTRALSEEIEASRRLIARLRESTNHHMSVTMSVIRKEEQKIKALESRIEDLKEMNNASVRRTSVLLAGA